MKAFHCDSCGSLVFFDTVRCVKCDHVLGFLPFLGELSALEPAGDETWKTLAHGVREQYYRQCVTRWQADRFHADCFHVYFFTIRFSH